MGLDEIENQRLQNEGIEFLVAGSINKNNCIVPLDKNIPIYVFYPAEKDLAPLKLLMHAEFIVKSDRTAIISIDDNRCIFVETDV